jgi:hypothetical protein
MRTLCLIALVACNAPGIRLFDDAETARIVGEARARFEAGAHARCPRPLLHGTAIPGPASPDMLAIYEPTGALGACIQRVHGVLDPIYAGKADDRIDKLGPLAPDCGPVVEEAISRAVSHEDACSPYRAAMHPISLDESPVASLMPAWLLAAHARVLAAHGEASRAMWVLLDGARLFQDTSRGDVPALPVMVAETAFSTLLEHARRILDGNSFSAHDLDKLGAAVDTLLATEPTFDQMMAGERAWQEQEFGLAPYDGKPERWGSGLQISSDPRDNAVLNLAVEAVTWSQATSDCPAGASLYRCAHAFAKRSSRESRDRYDEAQRAYASMRLGFHVRVSEIVELLADRDGPGDSAYRYYVASRVRIVTRLVALRLQLDVMRTGRCPTADELEAPPYSTLRRPAVLGDSIVVVREQHALDIAPPPWAQDERTQYIQPRCP